MDSFHTQHPMPEASGAPDAPESSQAPLSDQSRHDVGCLIVGGGPAGLTAALYLSRFNRPFCIVDNGRSRAGRIPASHNIPFFAEGIPGPELLQRQRGALARYGTAMVDGVVANLQPEDEGFTATVDERGGVRRKIFARFVILATGAADIEPQMPDLDNLVQRGLVRYCPICDGYEATNQRIAVLATDDHGAGEAAFMAGTYRCDVTLLGLGRDIDLSGETRARLRALGVKMVEDPVVALGAANDGIVALRARAGTEHRFDAVYLALGMKVRSDLATRLGARQGPDGALLVDAHNQTSVPGLYAAGDVVSGLNQIVVAMGHSAIAATAIHNGLRP